MGCSRRSRRSGTLAKADSPRRDSLVQTTAERLREIILSAEDGSCLGSLDAVAGLLGVGVVTVQQVARILEQEGLLRVRRGPGGGYYASRPDETGVERSVATYLRVHGSGYQEAIEVALLLNAELMAKAAHCRDETLRAALRAAAEAIDGARGLPVDRRMALDDHFLGIVYRMSSMPLTELIARVSRRLFTDQLAATISPGLEGERAWQTARRRIAEGILLHDEDYARDSSLRYRRYLLAKMRGDTEG